MRVGKWPYGDGTIEELKMKITDSISSKDRKRNADPTKILLEGDRGQQFPAESPSQSGRLDPIKVLVIDDDPTLGRLVEKSLGAGFRVVHEFGAPEPGALDFGDADLVVLDYRMPVRDGFAVLEEIRGCREDLPVIFLTGFGNPEVSEQALALGAQIFLTKPAGPVEIREAVASLLPRASFASETAPMEADPTASEIASEARSFRAKLPDERSLSGRLVRFSEQSVVVDLPSAASLAPGTKLGDLSFRFGRQLLSSPTGFVGDRISLAGGVTETEVIIPGLWHTIEGDFAGEDASDAESIRDRDSARAASRSPALPERFRSAVHELSGILREVEHEVSMHRPPSPSPGNLEALRRETEIVAEVSASHGPAFWDAVLRFETAADEVLADGLGREGKEFARKFLFPSALCSPFLARVVERPIGVPGDYGMLGQILGNPWEGHSLYGRIVNSWILGCGAAEAYRYRVALLDREIRAAAARCAAEGRKTRVLSMASGVAYEIQRFIESPPATSSAEFVMVDFSEVTLAEARRQFAALGALPQGVSVEMHQSSVLDLASRSRGAGGLAEGAGYDPGGGYDHVYCAGLFDYLSDRLIVRVVRYLHSLLAPGGALVVSNFTTRNPIRGWMTFVMDWELIYRTPEHFARLVEKAAPGAQYRTETDADGVEVYAIVESGQ